MIKLLLSLLRWWLHCAFVRTHRSLHQERVNFTICNLKKWRDFPGGPRVKTSPSNAEGMGSILGQEAKLPHALWPKNQNINWKQYYNKFNKDFKNCPHQKNLSKKWKIQQSFLSLENLFSTFKHTQCILVPFCFSFILRPRLVTHV